MRKNYVYLVFTLLLLSFASQGTIPLEEKNTQVMIPINLNATETIEIDNNQLFNRIITKSSLVIDFDLGDEYFLGNYEFNISLDIILEAIDENNNVIDNVFDQDSYQLAINNASSKARFYKDLTPFIVEGEAETFPFQKIKATLVSVPDYEGFEPALKNILIAQSRISMKQANSYSYDVSSLESISKSNLSANIQGKVLEMNWTDEYPITYYQLELLRLYNRFEVTMNSEEEITAIIDWSKALKHVFRAELDDNDNDLKAYQLSLTEGQGYYVYRIRPVGNYFGQGIANHKNFGAWSEGPSSGDTVLLDLNTVAPPYFYFVDPDAEHNYIMSRTFTEKDRVKEVITYASSLQQGKQVQTYLPSMDMTLITQTVLDHSARPRITTIPVPINGRLDTYEEQFMRAAGSSMLYKAKDFDADENYLDPEAVEETGNMSYYNNNPNASIPNAEGHPYSNIIYYNDPTGRVKEQSGVGEMHKIGGKSTKYFYASPSETELIALFGDEAYDSEQVFKLITVDPNNIATVTYKTKEGNVIATAVSFFEGADTNLEALESEPIEDLQVDDKITQNVKTPEGFVSSKRLAFLQNTTVNFNYNIKCEQVEELCQEADLDCDYKLEVILFKLDHNGNIEERIPVFDQALKLEPCQEIEGDQYKVLAPVVMNLTPGEYIVQKKLKAGSPTAKISENEENIDLQIKPITNLITSWLEKVDCEAMLYDFFASLHNLADAINADDLMVLQAFNNAEYPEFSASFSQDFFDIYAGNEANYKLIVPDLEIPTSLVLVTPCCQLNVPIKWEPPFRCVIEDENENGIIDPSEVPDFEAYTFEYLKPCQVDDLQSLVYNEYMKGWEVPGTFNLMVYHMLTDKYNTKNNAEEYDPEIDLGEQPNGVKPVLDGCGNPIPQNTMLACEGDFCPQYTCEELINCWKIQLRNLEAQLCQNLNFVDGPINISDEYDQESEDSEDAEDHDSVFDDNFSPKGFFMKLIKWLMEKKLSKRLREMQESGDIAPEYQGIHLVNDFLSCTGFQFAKIISPFDGTPLPADELANYDYLTDKPYNVLDWIHIPVQLKQEFSLADYLAGNSPFKKENGDYYYAPLFDWNPQFEEESILPNIKNPIYAFKYFQYEDVGLYQSLESMTCFMDPNDCYDTDNQGILILEDGKPKKIPCCGEEGDSFCHKDYEYPNLENITEGVGEDGNGKFKYVVDEFCGRGRIRCPYTYEFWSSAQRYTFYDMLKTYVETDAKDWQLAIKTCDDVVNKTLWYENKITDVEEEGYNYPGWIDKNQYAQLNLLEKLYYQQVSIQQGGETVTEFALTEISLMELIGDCNGGCEQKSQEIKNDLIELLLSKCYIIGGCKTEDTPEIVPEEDIDVIVAHLVQFCKNQCELTTFSCNVEDCRNINVVKSETGANYTMPNVRAGVSGYPDEGNIEFCDAQLGYDYRDFEESKCAYGYAFYDINGDLPGGEIYYCEYEKEEDEQYSWYEYTRVTQAMEWKLKMDIPSMCEDPEEDPKCCEDVPENGFKGNTFMPKGTYEIEQDLNVPYGLNTGNKPVESPKAGVNIHIDPNEP